MSNIKELIRQEINERIALQKDLLKIVGDSARTEGSIDALQGLRDSFLDTLPDEPMTDCGELEEEAEEWAENEAYGKSDAEFEMAYKGFIAGAEWQKRKMMDEAYEEEVQEVYRDDDGIHCSVSVGTDYKPGTIVYVITIPKEDEQ